MCDVIFSFTLNYRIFQLHQFYLIVKPPIAEPVENNHSSYAEYFSSFQET